MKKDLFVAMCLFALASCAPKQSDANVAVQDSVTVDTVAVDTTAVDTVE